MCIPATRNKGITEWFFVQDSVIHAREIFGKRKHTRAIYMNMVPLIIYRAISAIDRGYL